VTEDEIELGILRVDRNQWLHGCSSTFSAAGGVRECLYCGPRARENARKSIKSSRLNR
jgi:hypothetical protein